MERVSCIILKNIMNPPRFLIVGAAGFIGSHLYARLGAERAVATYHNSPVAGGVYFDAKSMRITEVLRDTPGITHAFLLHGIGKLDECARDPEGTSKINVIGMRQIIDDLATHDIKVVFTSTDAVFDGTRGHWTEEDATNPVMTYGKQKVEVERHLSATARNWIVARLSKVVGSDPGDHSLFGEWVRRINAGEPIRCAGDLVMTPIYVEDVVTALIELAEGEFNGIFNVCGTRSMSRLDLLRMFIAAVRKYRVVDSTVIPCSIRDFAFNETRPRNQSMIPDKLFNALGHKCETMQSVCERIAAEVYGPPARSISVPATSAP